MITVSIILLIVFNTYFSGFDYKDEWKKAELITLIKDTSNVLDKMHKLYRISINSSALDDFLSKLSVSKNTIWWVRTENFIRPSIVIACNCTKEEQQMLSDWFNMLEVNDRNVSIKFVNTKLDKINELSDALLIIGYQNLTKYKTSLESYLRRGKGIIELTDFPDGIDSESSEIFGIKNCSDVLPTCIPNSETNITFSIPTSAESQNYQIWKLFFHFPETFKAKTKNSNVPVEGGIDPCKADSSYNGTICLRNECFIYWLCNDSSGYKMYLDTNENYLADTLVKPRETFTLDGFKFLFSYALDNKTVAISFKDYYNFTDFLKPTLYPSDGNVNRIVLYRGYYQGSTNPIPAVVVNEKNGYRAVWMPNMTQGKLKELNDDERMILEAAILYAAKKESSPEIIAKIGYELPYINVVNTTHKDMYEVYALKIGAGYPY